MRHKEKLVSLLFLSVIGHFSFAVGYSSNDLRNIKDISASFRTAAAAMAAISQTGANDELKFIASLSREINKIAANAIKEQSQIIRIARILEKITAEGHWTKANLKESTFYKKIILVIAHSLTREIALKYKNKQVGNVLEYFSDNRLIGEIAQAMGKGVFVGAIDTSFEEIKRCCITGKTTSQNLMEFFFARVVATATKDLAYRIAGEVVRRNMHTGTRSELLIDIYDPCEEIFF